MRVQFNRDTGSIEYLDAQGYTRNTTRLKKFEVALVEGDDDSPVASELGVGEYLYVQFGTDADLSDSNTLGTEPILLTEYTDSDGDVVYSHTFAPISYDANSDELGDGVLQTKGTWRFTIALRYYPQNSTDYMTQMNSALGEFDVADAFALIDQNYSNSSTIENIYSSILAKEESAAGVAASEVEAALSKDIQDALAAIDQAATDAETATDAAGKAAKSAEDAASSASDAASYAEDAKNAVANIVDINDAIIKYAADVPTDPPAEGENYVYAVHDSESNLFALYYWDEDAGAWTLLGDSAIVTDKEWTYELELTSTGWTDGVQTIEVPNLKAADSVEVYGKTEPEYTNYGVLATSYDDGEVTFTADSLPDSDIANLWVFVHVTQENNLNADTYYTQDAADKLFLTDATISLDPDTGHLLLTDYKGTSLARTDNLDLAPAISKTIASSCQNCTQDGEVDIPTTAWESMAATVKNSYILSGNVVAFVPSDSDTTDDEGNAKASSAVVCMTNFVRITAQAEGAVTFTCNAVPASAIKGTLIIIT